MHDWIINRNPRIEELKFEYGSHLGKFLVTRKLGAAPAYVTDRIFRIDKSHPEGIWEVYAFSSYDPETPPIAWIPYPEPWRTE